MRVLFAINPEKTLFQPMVPLAWALRTAGHDVRVACQPSFVDEVTQAGLTAVPVGRNQSIWRLGEMSPENTEAERAGLPSPYDAAVLPPEEITWEAMQEGYPYLVENWHVLNNFPMMAGLVEFARHWRPDLIIWESLTYAASIAAKACGAACARLMWSIDVFGVARDHYLRLKSEQPPENRIDPMIEWLEPYARKYGVDFSEDMITGQFTIDQLPPSVSMQGDLDYLSVQYVPYGGAAVVPKWLWTPPERPRIALTLGTTAPERFAGYAAGVQDILEALSDLDIEVVATVAEKEQAKLTHIPDNTRLVTYVPLHALAPTCTAIINHAGPGTFLTTALHAVPQLHLPWDFDEPELARRAAEHGSSLSILADQATGQNVREAVQRLLNEPAFRDRAAGLREEILALPTPNDLVAQLEERTANR